MTSKKLVGTLAVMAVAAIAPASAGAAPDARPLEQISMGVKAPASESAFITELSIPGLTGSNAPRANSSEIAVESLTQARNLNDIDAIDLNTPGTQVGSEGVRPRS